MSFILYVHLLVMINVLYFLILILFFGASKGILKNTFVQFNKTLDEVMFRKCNGKILLKDLYS